MNDAARQAELYNGIWQKDANYGTKMADVMDTVYHRIIPHMLRVDNRLGQRVADFGAGDGRFLRELQAEGLCGTGIAVDVYKPKHAPNDVQWHQVPMWEANVQADYVISTDALEHLPPDRVDETLDAIAKTAPHGFLRVSLTEDRYGTERGLHLHESVFPSIEWLIRLKNAGVVVTSYRVYLGDNAKELALEVWF